MNRPRRTAIRSASVSEFAIQSAKHLLDEALDRLKDSPRRVVMPARDSMQYKARELTDAVIQLADKDPDYWGIIVVEAKRIDNDTVSIVFRKA